MTKRESIKKLLGEFEGQAWYAMILETRFREVLDGVSLASTHGRKWHKG
jgi:hypothetical protein